MKSYGFRSIDAGIIRENETKTALKGKSATFLSFKKKGKAMSTRELGKFFKRERHFMYKAEEGKRGPDLFRGTINGDKF